MRFFYLIICIGLASCSTSTPPIPTTQEDKTPAKRDLRSYQLDKTTKEAAPYMQDHLYKVAALNSPIAFPVKPEFAFIDQDEDKRGQLNPLITRMNLMHVALWEKEQHIWSGTVMHGVGRGWMGVTRAGRVFKIAIKEERLTLSFTDGEHKIEVPMTHDQPNSGWHNLGPRRLYFNYFTFPEGHVFKKSKDL